MHIRFIAVLCTLTMLLACFLAPERAESLPGTWVIYEGGSVVYDILHFDESGTGEGYRLPEEYDEVWLRGEPVPDELLADPNPFQWLTTGGENDQLELTFEDGRTLSLELSYEENMAGTGLLGISLSNEMIGSGGYVQADMDE